MNTKQGSPLIDKMQTKKRYMRSFFVVVVIIDLVITTLLFAMYSSIQIQKSKEHFVAQLSQICNLTDVLYNSVISASNQIIQDPNTYSCLKNIEIDRLIEAKACAKLRNIQTANNHMRYVSLYNSATNRFLSNAYAGEMEAKWIKEYTEILGDDNYAVYMRKIGENYNAQSKKWAEVYTFLFKVQIRPGGTPDILIIDVSESYLAPILDAIKTPDSSQEVVILDNKNRIITSQVATKGEDNFEQMYMETNFDSSELKSSTEKSGAINYRSDDFIFGKFLTYARAANSGFTIVNLLPYSAVVTGITQIGILTLMLSALTMIFGYIISKRMSGVLYAPIKNLYDNYVSKSPAQRKGNELDELRDAFSTMNSKANTLEQGLIAAYNESHKLYLEYLLRGRTGEIKNAENIYSKIGIDIYAEKYTVALIECLISEIEENQRDIFICNYALENMVGEVLDKFGKSHILRIGEGTFAVLIDLKANAGCEELAAALTTAVNVMKNEFLIETTICLGRVIEGSQEINLCYEATRIAMANSSHKCHGTVFIAGDAARPLAANQYHNRLHSKLAELIRVDDLDACGEEFDTAISAMDNISFHTAKIYFNHVMMSLMDDFSFSIEKNQDVYNRLSEDLDHVINVTNVKGLKKIVMKFISEIIKEVGRGKKSGNQDAVQAAKNYIDQNYSDSNLCIRMLSDIVGLSPAYFGKMFTASTTYTVNDYMNNTRMNKAAQMLRETKLPVTQISQKVGILNANYFYAIFKKHYGITPAAFRENNKKA